MSSPRSSQASRPTNAIACLTCRTRHLKCDARLPICGRCAKSELSCTYHQSRRGRRSRQAPILCNERDVQPAAAEASTLDQNVNLWDIASNMEPGIPLDVMDGNTRFDLRTPSPAAPSSSNDDFGTFADQWDGTAFSFDAPLDFLASCLTTTARHGTYVLTAGHSMSSDSAGEENGEQLIALYYKHFHPAHPFMLPYRLYMQNHQAIPHSVQVAMQFAGSHFTSTIGRQWTVCPATALILGEERVSTFTIQGLLILAIAYYGRCEERQSLVMLRKAKTLALHLRINDRATVRSTSQGDSVFEESVLRTWWELGNIITLLSVFSASEDVALHDLPDSDLELPCEEIDYIECKIPAERRTRQQFLDKSLSGDPFEHSSFAYKIEASRLLKSVQALGSDWWSIDKDRILTVDNRLSNYHLSMPFKKRDVMGNDGTVDEVLFAAKIFASIALILISRPRSTLVCLKGQPRIACTKKITDVAYETSGQHTFQAVQAANSLADAAGTRSSPCAVMCHSPFFACAMALASTIHLPTYSQSNNNSTQESIRERIKLTTNALVRIGENWPLGKVVGAQVLEAVREVLGCTQAVTRSIPANCIPLSNPPENTVHADWLDLAPRDLEFLNQFMT